MKYLELLKLSVMALLLSRLVIKYQLIQIGRKILKFFFDLLQKINQFNFNFLAVVIAVNFATLATHIFAKLAALTIQLEYLETEDGLNIFYYLMSKCISYQLTYLWNKVMKLFIYEIFFKVSNFYLICRCSV